VSITHLDLSFIDIRREVRDDDFVGGLRHGGRRSNSFWGGGGGSDTSAGDGTNTCSA
jgi:hypothetical protein